MADNHWNGANGHGMGGGARHRGERFQSPRGRFPDDRGFDGGRAGHQGGHGTWNSPRAPIQHPRQNFHERDDHRDWQNGSVMSYFGSSFQSFFSPERWGNAHADRNAHHRRDRIRNEPRSPSRGLCHFIGLGNLSPKNRLTDRFFLFISSKYRKVHLVRFF